MQLPATAAAKAPVSSASWACPSIMWQGQRCKLTRVEDSWRYRGKGAHNEEKRLHVLASSALVRSMSARWQHMHTPKKKPAQLYQATKCLHQAGLVSKLLVCSIFNVGLLQ